MPLLRDEIDFKNLQAKQTSHTWRLRTWRYESLLHWTIFPTWETTCAYCCIPEVPSARLRTIQLEDNLEDFGCIFKDFHIQTPMLKYQFSLVYTWFSFWFGFWVDSGMCIPESDFDIVSGFCCSWSRRTMSDRPTTDGMAGMIGQQSSQNHNHIITCCKIQTIKK